MKKSLLATILLSAIMIPINSYAKEINTNNIINQNNIVITPSEYQKLLDMGYTDSQIMFFDEEVISRNINSSSRLVDTKISYLKTIYTYDNGTSTYSVQSRIPRIPIKVEEIELSAEEYQREVSNSLTQDGVNDVTRTHEYGYRTLTTNLYKEGTYANPEYRVSNVVQWSITPSIRSFDISAIVFSTEGISVKKGSQYALQTWSETDRITKKKIYDNLKYSTNSTRYSLKSNGISISMNLLNDTTSSVMGDMNSYLEYVVVKNISTKINTLNFKSTYVHATSGVSFEDIVGLAFDPSKEGVALLLLKAGIASRYDDGNKIYIQANGVNW